MHQQPDKTVQSICTISMFVGDWEVTLIKTKTREYPSWFEIKYPVRMSFRLENGKLVGSYTDQYDFSNQFFTARGLRLYQPKAI
jgi:hypothetical protein